MIDHDLWCSTCKHRDGWRTGAKPCGDCLEHDDLIPPLYHAAGEPAVDWMTWCEKCRYLGEGSLCGKCKAEGVFPPLHYSEILFNIPGEAERRKKILELYREARKALGYTGVLSDPMPAKDDAEKLRLSLVPPELVEAVAEVREYGNRKYGDPDNWKTVEAERYWDAILRHVLAAWNDWHSLDHESGLPHLFHIATNCAFLCAMMKKEMGVGDDA